MEDRPDREHVLQKIVAVSGFLFALLILPIAQFVLVNGRANGTQEQGTVAGVSTDETVTTRADISQDPAQCTVDKQKKIAELQSWVDGRLAALSRDYMAKVKPYQDALPLITVGDVEAERAAVNQMIADETGAYENKKSQIIAAVDAQTKEYSAIDCGAVPTE